MSSTGDGLPTPASAVWDPVATMWVSAAPPSTGLMSVPSQLCLPRPGITRVPPETWERTARNTQNPPSLPVPFRKGTSFEGLEQTAC